MSDIIKKHYFLETKILESHERVKQINPEHSLLDLVTVDKDIGIEWTAKFSVRYTGMEAYDGLNQYVLDLKKAFDENFI